MQNPTSDDPASPARRRVLLGAAAMSLTPSAWAAGGTFEDMVQARMKSGAWVELTPQHAQNFSALREAARQQGYDEGALKIILDRTNDNPEPLARLRQESGMSYLMINDAAHEWTGAFVAQVKNPPMDAVRRKMQEGVLEDASSRLSPAVMKAFHAQVKGIRRLASAPLLLLDRSDATPLLSVSAYQTREGDPIILMNRYFLLETGDREKVNVLAHELSHFKHGDLDPAVVARAHNDRSGAFARSREMAADQSAVEMTCDPQGLRSALLKGERRSLATGSSFAPETGAATHPGFMERIRPLTQPGNLPAACKKTR